MDPPGRPGAAEGTLKPWPGGSRGLSGPRPPRHLGRLPAAVAPARAVAAAVGHSMMLPWQHVQSSATGKTGGQGACCAKCLQISCIVPCRVTRRKGAEEGEGGAAKE